ncbi:MAG: DUF4214 domain-containing protein, partial [Acidimicrobiia bacterium]|nr:DUF4214 domain-containing protein [Acidimicrobiia bacterium]
MNVRRGRDRGRAGPGGVVAVLTIIASALVADPSAADVEPGLTSMPAPIVVESVDPTIPVDDPELLDQLSAIHDDFDQGMTRHVAEPVLSWPQAAMTNSGFTVTFDSTHTAPSSVQAVIVAAAQDWDDVLATSMAGPVEIAVIWRDLGSPSLLGSAGPSGLYASASLPSSSYYAAGLANTLLGTDVNGAATPELTVNLNSTANWYIGTTGNPTSGQVDLYSVVLHEIGHGLGFLGSASISNDPGPAPTLENPSFVFDEAVTHNGESLLSTSDPNSLLQSGNLHIDISAGLQQQLYVPAGWQEGSSFSHFDESAIPAGTPGALMTPSITVQETERVLDAPVLGVMAGMGWPMAVTATTPTLGTVVPGSAQATLSWTTDFAVVGLPPDGYRIEAWRDGVTLDSTQTVAATATATTITALQNGSDYTLTVTPFAGGVDGTAASVAVTLQGVPGAPSIVTAQGSGLTQTIAWSDASGTGITGYEVERSLDGVTWLAVGSTTGTSLVTTVAEGVHQFRVRASNNHGPGDYGYTIPVGISAGVVRPVALDGQLGRLYEAYFQRDPDAAGFGFWQGQRAGGAQLGDISDVFAASAEFVDVYGSLSDSEFVELVYQNVLSRPADAAGLAYWVGQLAAGVSRGTVMTGFSESAEYIVTTGTVAPASTADDEVYRLYVAFFLRFPDAAGDAYWTSVRSGGASLESIAASFAASAEFVAAYGSLPDSQFVELVYNNVLGRTADAAGAAYWEGQLAAGLDRGAMMVGFSESAEFIMATGTLP